LGFEFSLTGWPAFFNPNTLMFNCLLPVNWLGLAYGLLVLSCLGWSIWDCFGGCVADFLLIEGNCGLKTCFKTIV